jgi:hypothetical protein
MAHGKAIAHHVGQDQVGTRQLLGHGDSARAIADGAHQVFIFQQKAELLLMVRRCVNDQQQGLGR